MTMTSPSRATMLDRLTIWLTPAIHSLDDQFRDSHGIFVRLCLITLPFSLLYVLVSFAINFHVGVLLMLACFNSLIVLMLIFRKTGLYRLCSNMYLAICFFVAILGCSAFTGGIHSMVTSWFVLIPTASSLLLNNKKDTLIWVTLTCLAVSLYCLLDLLGVVVPTLYPEKFTEIFNAACLIGLALILSFIAIMFGNFVRQQGQFADDIINHLPGLFYMLNTHGEIIRANRQFPAVSGRQEKEIGNMTMLEFFESQDREMIGQWLHDSFNHKTATADAHFITRSGSKIPYHFSGGVIRVKDQDYLVGLGTDISAHRQIESALQASENRYRNFIDRLPLGIAITRDGRIKYANQSLAILSGYSREELLAPPFLSGLPESDNPQLQGPLPEQLWDKEGDSFYTIKIRQKSGEIRLWEIHASPTEWEGKSSSLSIINDITERMEAEQQLIDLLNFNKKTIGSSPVGILTYRATDGACISANESAARISGTSLDGLLQTNFRNLIDWQQYGLHRMADEVIASGQSSAKEVYITTSFGRKLWANVRMTGFSNLDTQYLLLILEDITSRKQMETDLQLQSEITAHALEGIALIKASDSSIIYTNQCFDAIFGYGCGELTGKNVSCLNANEGESSPAQIADEINRHLKQDGKWRGEILSRKKDGSVFWSFASISSFLHAQHGLLWVTYQSDISRRKESESALVAATAEAKRASHAKSIFLASVSHDLRQPLSALSITVDSLKNRLLPGNEKIWSNMKVCINDLSKMLANLLDLSTLEAGAVTPDICDFPVDDVISGTIFPYGMKAESKGLVLRGRGTRLTGHTDPVLFQRIIRNLVSNAVRYTEHGGILIGCRRRGGKHWIEVWDTGIGIPPDKTGEIFEEFRQIGNPQRDHTRGSGLGLAIVAKTAKLLGLEIRVQSRFGRGSMFAVEIPLGQAVIPQVMPQYEHRPLRIILVEDNLDVAEAFLYGLSEMGHEVTFAASLAELMLELETISSPEIVISDYRLAENGSGLDAIAAVQKKFGPVPGLIITGDTDPHLIQKLSASGIRILHKPVTLDRLKQAIAELTLS